MIIGGIGREKRRDIKNMRLLKVVNVLLALDLIIIVTAAILKGLLIPRGLYLYFHVLPGFIFVALVILHIGLNRKWIINTYFNKR